MTLSEIKDLIEKKGYAKAKKVMNVLKQEGYPYTDETAILDAAIIAADMEEQRKRGQQEL